MPNPIISRPVVSVGLPVYNGAPYLSETLDSIVRQTYERLEIIIRDNSSVDNTPEIVSGFMRKDDRIRYYRTRHNEGAAKNYNAVFDISTGKYFKWAAADDVLAPDFIEQCVVALEHNADCILAYSQTNVIDSDGRVTKLLDEPLHVGSDNPTLRFRSLRRNLRECNAVFGLIRRDTLAQTHLIRSYISADVHLLAELSLYGKFLEIPERLFFRRDHQNASSANRSEESQAGFYDPKCDSKPLMSYWNGLIQDTVSILRAPISRRNQITLIGFIARTAFWSKAGLVREAKDYLMYIARRVMLR